MVNKVTRYRNNEISGAMPSVDPHMDPTAYAAERQRLEVESEQRILAQAEANEATLQKETEDSTWSGEARDLIINAIADGGLAGTSIQDVECRATLCRVEVTHKDRQARAVFEQRFMPAIAQLLPQAMPRTPAHRPAVSRWGRSPCRSHNGHNGAGCCPLPDLPGYS